MKKILVIDNHDSFVYNIVQLLREAECAPQFDVVKNDEVIMENLDGYDGLLLSPGPGIPSEAGKMMEAILHCWRTKAILGICLGHQAIAEAFGGSLLQLTTPFHGHRSFLRISDDGDPVLHGIPQPAEVGRYHSWVVDPETLPDCLCVSSTDEDGNIMSLRHRKLPVFGVQFHPESYISNCGAAIIANWLSII